jgi:hypothetical protein
MIAAMVAAPSGPYGVSASEEQLSREGPQGLIGQRNDLERMNLRMSERP